MKKYHSMTTGDVARIEQMIDEGCTNKEISDTVGCHPTTIGYYRRKLGKPPVARTRPHLSKEKLEKIEALSKSKWRQADIAKEVGCSVDTVRDHQQRLGIPASNRFEPSGQYLPKKPVAIKPETFKEEVMAISAPKNQTKPGEWVEIVEAAIKLTGSKTSFTYTIGLLNSEITIHTGYGDPIPLDARDLVAFGNELLDMADKITALKNNLAAGGKA